MVAIFWEATLNESNASESEVPHPHQGEERSHSAGFARNPRLQARYQIVMGVVVVATTVKQLAAGCDQWIILYQNWAVWYSSCGKKPLHEGSFKY